ncbi:legumain-like [Haemaphysalis longicornis]
MALPLASAYFILVSTALFCSCVRIQEDVLRENYVSEDGVKLWALLVAGSNGYPYYRHQADVCHAYHVLHNHGVPDEQIVVMMYDDIAYAVENPTPGVVVNHVNGSNLYPGVVKDYTGDLVTSSNFLNVLQGQRPSGGGTGKVIASGPQDHVFVFYSGLGGGATISFPKDELNAKDLIDAIVTMHKNGRFSKMVVYIEASEAGAMFADGLLPDNVSVYATTAANPSESSYACYYDDLRETYLGDVYSVNWMEDSDRENLQKETLEDQFKTVREKTITSVVMEYGDLRIGAMTVSQFQGNQSAPAVLLPHAPLDAVSSRDVPVSILSKKISKASDPNVKQSLIKELERMLDNRSFVREKVMEIATLLSYGSTEEANLLLTKNQPLTDFDCYKEAVQNFSRKCFALSSSTYALSYLNVFVNACEKFDVEVINRAMSAVCYNFPAVRGIV